ncbi:hypothetical protein Phou_033960 [Phytohabitans houttuyneae]|uniref:Tryptophan synthase beta chain-like PALP domain-containing protein n=1 Tax=Phytohabitans houttuyneae TaxID=1076126 RepID=A0A6V8KB73_9ACTN|nr:hypothetical protein Phou_033960 [Phytohabitans houttuyneae]
MPSPISQVLDERLAPSGVRLHLKRDDLIHPEIPGNKWRKLKYNLAAARERGHRTLLTFGGAHSNHIRAVAAAGHYFGFATIGVIRGEEHLPLNPTLAYATGRGMRLHYLDRTTYRAKTSPQVIAGLRRTLGTFTWYRKAAATPSPCAAVPSCPGRSRSRSTTSAAPRARAARSPASRSAWPASSGRSGFRRSRAARSWLAGCGGSRRSTAG